MPRSRAAHVFGFLHPPSQMDHRLVLRVLFLKALALVVCVWGAPQIAPKPRLQQPAVQVCNPDTVSQRQLPIARLDSAIDAISFSSPERLSAVTAQRNFLTSDSIV